MKFITALGSVLWESVCLTSLILEILALDLWRRLTRT